MIDENKSTAKFTVEFKSTQCRQDYQQLRQDYQVRPSADLEVCKGRAPLPGQNVFFFMQFSEKNCQIVGWRPLP